MKREKLEAELRQAQQRLQHVVISNPAILFTLAAANEQIQGISWISDNVLQILGYTPAEALALDWWNSHIHPDDRDAIVADTHTALFAAGHTAHEFRFKHADGQYRWTKCRIRLIRDEPGRPVEAVGVWLDVTDRKHAEEEQSKLREQLQQAQKLESVARLAGGAAHDFNNLLTVINGYSDFLLRRLPPENPLREYAAEIRMAGERAALLSQQLLTLSRKQIVQAVEIDLNDIIGEVGKMLGRIIGEDIRLQYRLDPQLGRIRADPGQLHQVLMNLAVNARDAMPGGGTLLVETANVSLGQGYADQHVEVTAGPYVHLKVSDTGIGMNREVLSHLFEPFFTTKAPGEGTGLGLATVHGIVKQYGGSISVYSESGHGSAFSIYLPRIEQGTAPTLETTPTLRQESVWGTETILLVEDHEQVRAIAVRILRGCGYTVLEAANPEDAQRQSEKYAGMIHLLLTDVIMPGMSGRQLAERIVKSRPSIAVVFMSAYSEPAIHERGVLPSSVNFLSKPFSPKALAIKVREVLGLPRAAGSVLIVDDDPGVRKFLRTTLGDAGFEVVEARNGADAVRQMQKLTVNLVIIDLSMPEPDGLETIGILRQQKTNARIIAISGRFPQLLRAAEHLGADAALPKPISPDDLFETIKRVMERPQ